MVSSKQTESLSFVPPDDPILLGGRGRYHSPPAAGGKEYGYLYLRTDATVYEALHELEHMKHHAEIGPAFRDLNDAQREMAVYRRTFRSARWSKLTPEEQADARNQAFIDPYPDGSRGPDFPPDELM